MRRQSELFACIQRLSKGGKIGCFLIIMHESVDSGNGSPEIAECGFG
jgi:hypothetical protein